MSINKNKPIHKGFASLKKRLPVVLTLSNGLFIHLLGCNAHQVSNEFIKGKSSASCRGNNYGNFFNQRRIRKKLDHTEDLINEKDLLKIPFRIFNKVVNQMYLEGSKRNDNLYNVDSVIKELDLLGRFFYEAYCGVNLESSKGYLLSDKRKSSNLKKLYKAVEKGYQTRHSKKNKESVIRKIDILYQVFRIIYRVVLKPSNEFQATVQKSCSNIGEGISQMFGKSPAEYRKIPIKFPETIKLLHEAYEIFCIEICNFDPKALDMYTEPGELLLDIKNVTEEGLEKLNEL